MRLTTKLQRLERAVAQRFPKPEPPMAALTDEERQRRIRALWEYDGTDPDTLMRQKRMKELVQLARERQQAALAAAPAAGQSA